MVTENELSVSSEPTLDDIFDAYAKVLVEMQKGHHYFVLPPDSPGYEYLMYEFQQQQQKEQ